MMQQTRTYRERSRAFLVKAREELEAGDLEQASEKGWGAAALMVKAVAERRGMEHKRHGQLFQVVGTLARETGDDNINDLFVTASGVHANFYEDWFTVEQVSRSLDKVDDFVRRVEALLPEQQ